MGSDVPVAIDNGHPDAGQHREAHSGVDSLGHGEVQHLDDLRQRGGFGFRQEPALHRDAEITRGQSARGAVPGLLGSPAENDQIEEGVALLQ